MCKLRVAYVYIRVILEKKVRYSLIFYTVYRKQETKFERPLTHFNASDEVFTPITVCSNE